MDIRQNKKIMQALDLTLALTLSVHITLLFIFVYFHITIMVYMNIGSVLIYGLLFYFRKKRWVKMSIYVSFFEIIIHTILATFCLGYSAGFQLYFIDCIAAMFFVEYLAARLGIHSIGSLKLGIACSLLYIVFMIVTRYYDPIYHIDANIAFLGTVINSILTLAVIVSFFDQLSKMAVLYEKDLRKHASYDNLTGLINRHYLMEYMEEVYTSENISEYWLAILDIDDFKKINDQYGHLCGDVVLKSVAHILKELCDDYIVCRWGGEEFMIVGMTSNSHEMALLEDIRKNIETHNFVYNDTTMINLTVTIGEANYQNGQTLSDWFNMADARLYKGKQSGKNRVISS